MEVISFADNFRLKKVLVVAKYADIQLKVSHSLPSALEKNPLLKSNSHDNSPVLITEFGPINNTNSISKYFAKQSSLNLLGETPFEQALIEQWIDYSFNEIDLPALAWLGPILGYFPETPAATRRAQDDVQRVLNTLDLHLKDKTFLVSERITLADIVVSLSLYPLYTNVLTPTLRQKHKNTNRWFSTLASQPNFIAVLGEVSLCEGASAKQEQGAVAEKKDQKKSEKKVVSKGDAEKKKEEKKGGEGKKQQQQQRREGGEGVAGQVYFAEGTGPFPAEISVCEDGHVSRIVLGLVKGELNVRNGEKTSARFGSGEVVEGDLLLARYLARAYPRAELYGEDVFSASLIDHWLALLPSFQPSPFQLAHTLDLHLPFRTYLAGHRLSIADLAVYFHIKGQAFPPDHPKVPHFDRWLNYISKIVGTN